MRNGLSFKESGIGKVLQEQKDSRTWGHRTYSVGLRLAGHRTGHRQLYRRRDAMLGVGDECDFIRIKDGVAFWRRSQ